MEARVVTNKVKKLQCALNLQLYYKHIDNLSLEEQL